MKKNQVFVEAGRKGGLANGAKRRRGWDSPDRIMAALKAQITVRQDGCWIFAAHRTAPRYRTIMIGGRMQAAHRVSWRLHNGPIPDGCVVCHRCDEPKCVNPEHLFVGTSSDNMRDMVAKGRQKYQWGEANASARLTDAQVVEIRARYLRYGARRSNAGALAAEYGVNRKYLVEIANGSRRTGA